MMLRTFSNSFVGPLRLGYKMRVSESNLLLVEDEELIHQVNVAVSSEEERLRKLKSQTKTKPAYVTQIGQEAEYQKYLLVKSPP